MGPKCRSSMLSFFQGFFEKKGGKEGYDRTDEKNQEAPLVPGQGKRSTYPTLAFLYISQYRLKDSPSHKGKEISQADGGTCYLDRKEFFSHCESDHNDSAGKDS